MILESKIMKMLNLWHLRNIRPLKICTSMVNDQQLRDLSNHTSICICFPRIPLFEQHSQSDYAS